MKINLRKKPKLKLVKNIKVFQNAKELKTMFPILKSFINLQKLSI